MSTTNIMPYDEDEVLVQFAQAEQPNLSEWIQQYPTQARELARFAASRWADGKSEWVADTATVSRVREIGLSIVQARRGMVTNKVGITTLLGVAIARGMDGHALASKLDIPFALLVKLQRRLIALESVPQTFIMALAETLGRQADEIRAYLSLPSTFGPNTSWSSDNKPLIADREIFALALQEDPEVTASQKTRWLGEG